MLPFVTHQKVLLIAVATVASIIDLPFGVASSAAVPNLVSGEDGLNWANGLMGAAGNASRLAGPLLGGLLYAVGGTSLAFGLNAGSYVVSAILVASIHNRFSASGTGPEDATGAMEGFRVILRDPLLLRLAIVATSAYFALNIAFVADVPLAQKFHVGSFGYGLIDTVFGAGLLAGSVLSRRIRPGTELSWVRRGMLGIAVGWAVIAVTPWFVFVLVGSFIAALLLGYETTAEMTIFQEGSTDANRGRVMAAIHTSGMVANVVGFAIAGAGVTAFGGQAVYALGAAIATVGFLVTLGIRRDTGRGDIAPEAAAQLTP
ncbi:MAG TPA: MFS transporter [Micromonosporaceae bacterium]|nr:MFS transporter [Micromonosporaceae bacterium]